MVNALAGPGKSHLARCLVNRWGSMSDNRQGFLVMALRARTLRQELLETLLLDKVAWRHVGLASTLGASF